MDGHVLHGRNDDPLDVSARIADVVHGRVSTVLSIVLIAVLGTFLNVVEVLPIRVYEFDLSAVSVDIDDGPQWSSSFDTAEEDSFFLPINSKVNISSRCHIIEKDWIPISESLSQSFRPVSWFIRQIRASVFRQSVAQIYWVVACESKTDDTAPVVGNCEELDADLK